MRVRAVLGCNGCRVQGGTFSPFPLCRIVTSDGREWLSRVMVRHSFTRAHTHARTLFAVVRDDQVAT